MVTRRLLTPEYVDGLKAPPFGEIWIADTRVKGFGIRLWAARSGAQKSFALRTSNIEGKSIRKSFDYRKAEISFEYFYETPPTMGAALYEAREWARREISQLKRPTEHISWQAAHSKNPKRVRAIKLGVAAERLIRSMKAKGLTEKYIDRLDKLFFRLPAKIRDRPLGQISPKLVAKTLIESNLSSYNIVTLRSFLSQLFLKAANSHGPFISFPEKLSEEFWVRWRKARDVRFPELRDLNDQQYLEIFSFLESHPNWQRALAIRLYFEFKAPLQRIMDGRWSQIARGSWFPYFPDERVYWLSHEDRVEGEKERLLQTIRTKVSENFGRSIYWFPTPAGKPIRTVQAVWKDALMNVGLRYYPLKEFSRSYRELNNPSYYVDFLRSFGEAIAEGKNAAELSKILSHQKINPLFSDTYR